MSFRNRIFTLMLSVILIVTYIPAIAFADVESGEADTNFTSEENVSDEKVITSYEVDLEDVEGGEELLDDIEDSFEQSMETITQDSDESLDDTEGVVELLPELEPQDSDEIDDTDDIVNDSVIDDSNSEIESQESDSEMQQSENEPAFITEDIAIQDEQIETEETTDPSEDEVMLTWLEFARENGGFDNLSKEKYIDLYNKYQSYVLDFKDKHGQENREGSGGGTFANDYIEAAISDSGHFTFGTVQGNPNYSSDNYQKLLYGHPDPSTSETLITIDGDYEDFFNADTVKINKTDKSAVAVMKIDSYDITITQTIRFIESGKAGHENTAKIIYKVVNNDSIQHDVGIRIMLDTMLADNDEAPFRITGTGNVTTAKEYVGSSVPKSYQVYDNLEKPSTLATGYLYQGKDRKPDKVQFCNWSGIRGSSWNHTVYDGDTLGDSAVGIYFYPKSIAPGKLTSVTTYYGVSVGASIDDSTASVLGTGDVNFAIKDVTTNKAIPNASVTLKRADGTELRHNTDENGVVGFNGFDKTEEKVTVKVKATVNGFTYPEQSFTKKVKKGYGTTLYIKSDQDDCPMITSVTMDGKDILSGTVNYYEDKNKEISNTKNSGVAEVMVTADMQGCTYYFVQNETVLEKNKTGIFRFTTLKKNYGTLISSLSAVGNRYVMCVSQDGKKSRRMTLGIKVSQPTFSGSAFDLRIADFWPASNSAIASGTLAYLFLGDKFKFGPKDSSLKFVVEVTENNTVRVGLNLSEMPKNALEAKNLNSDLLKSDYDKYKKNKSSIRPKKQTPTSFGAGSFFLDIYGYGEGQYVGNQLKIDVAVKVTGGYKGKHTTVWWFTVPVYITVGAGGQVSASGLWNLVNGTGVHLRLAPYKFTIEPQGFFSLEGGFGADGIAKIGAEGKATIGAIIECVTKHVLVTLTGEANLVAQALFWEKSANFAKGTWTIYDSNNKSGTVYGGEDIVSEFNEMPYRLMDRKYLDNETPVGGDGMEITNSVPFADPVIVNYHGTPYKFWIEADSSGDVSNCTRLVYEKMEDGWWSNKTIVMDDGTSDFYFDVAAGGNGIDVLWHNSNKQFDDNTVTPDETAHAGEIWYARIIPGDDDTIQTYQITNDNETDSLPSVAVSGNNVYVSWYHSANGIEDMSHDSYVYYTVINSSNGEHGEIRAINCGNKAVSSIKTHLYGDGAIVSYSLMERGSYSSYTPTICTVEFGSDVPTEITNEEAQLGSIVRGTIDGQDKLFWLENGNVVYSDSLNGEKEKVFNEDELPGNIGSDFTVYTDNESTKIIWSGLRNPEEDAKYAYCVEYKNGVWMKPYELTSLYTEAMVSSLGAYTNDEGRLVLSYVYTEYSDDGNIDYSEMTELVVENRESFEITELEYDEYAAAPGVNLPVTVNVHNYGSKDISGLRAVISDEYGYEICSQEFNGISIAKGQTGEVTIDEFIVPTTLTTPGSEDEPYRYYLTLISDNDVEVDQGCDLELGYVNLYVNQIEDMMIDDQLCKAIEVVNGGGLEAKDVHLRIQADSVEGSLVEEQLFESLSAGESATVYIPTEGLEDTETLYASVTTGSLVKKLSDDSEEKYYYTIIPLSNETLLIGDDYALTVNSTIGGTASGPSDEEEALVGGASYNIVAVADEGYVFDYWSSSEETTFSDPDSAETSFIMPESDTTITAHFVKNVSSDFALESATEDPITSEMSVGDTQQIKAVFGENERGKVVWTSSNPDVVSVNGRGTITALKAGRATITVLCGEYSRTLDIQVKDIPITSIEMVYPSCVLTEIGETETIDYYAEPIGATETAMWTSSDESVVTVDENGVITACGYGSAVVTVSAATNDSIKAVTQVTVLNTDSAITIDKTEYELSLGEEGQDSCTATVEFDPPDAPSRITWDNFDEDIVDLETSGDYNETIRVTAKCVGKALICASNEQGAEVWISITVSSKPNGIDIYPETTSANPLIMELFSSYYCDASLEPQGATGEILWTSSNDQIVTTNDYGELYAKKTGTAQITVSCEGISKAIYVKVVKSDVVNVTGKAQMQSDHNYANSLNRYWVYKNADAKKIRLTFSSDTATENYYDNIYIYDGSDNLIGQYTGTELAGKIVTINGNTAQVRLKTDGSETAYGFRVTKLETGRAIKSADVTVSNQVYKGADTYGNLKVVVNGVTLKSGTDYTATYSNNNAVGKATVTVKGKGIYSGSVTKNYTISFGQSTVNSLTNTASGVKISWEQVPGAAGYYIYRKTSKGAYVKVKRVSGEKTLSTTDTSVKKKNGTTYTYAIAAYKNTTVGNKSTGKTILRLTAPTLTSASPGKSKITVKYSKNSKAGGYEISYKVGKTTKTVTVKGASTVKYVIKKLKKGKTYSVKVRAYKSVNGTKTYSAWSSIKKTKVK